MLLIEAYANWMSIEYNWLINQKFNIVLATFVINYRCYALSSRAHVTMPKNYCTVNTLTSDG